MPPQLDRERPLLGVIPRPTFTDKSTYVESDTKKYDKMAFRYLSWLLYPLLGAYAVYSVMYQEHRGWYSWVLNIMYGFLLIFGEYQGRGSPVFLTPLILMGVLVVVSLFS